MARVDPTRLRWWLPYRTLFCDGIVRLKGNGLMAIVEYRGPDLDDVLNEELLVLAERLGGHLGQFGRQMGWTLNAEVRVVPAAGYRQAPAWLTGEEGDDWDGRVAAAPAGVAEDPVKACDAPAYLDDLRRRRFAGRLFEQRTFLAVAMRPGSGLAKALERYLKAGADTIAERWGPYLEDFRDFARTFTATLDALFCRRRRLGAAPGCQRRAALSQLCRRWPGGRAAGVSGRCRERGAAPADRPAPARRPPRAPRWTAAASCAQHWHPRPARLAPPGAARRALPARLSVAGVPALPGDQPARPAGRIPQAAEAGGGPAPRPRRAGAGVLPPGRHGGAGAGRGRHGPVSGGAGGDRRHRLCRVRRGADDDGGDVG